MKNSLQHTLFLWISLAILSTSFLAAAVSFWLSLREAQRLQDDGLHQIALLVDTYKTPILEEQILESINSDPKRIVVQPVVLSPATLPPLLRIPANLAVGYHTVKIDGLRWRIYVFASQSGEHIAVAQEEAVRRLLARDVMLLTFLPLLVLVPILIVVTRKIIRHGTSSLKVLADFVDAQNETHLSNLPNTPVPDEVAPFIRAINRLLQRINQLNEAQRRFIADAAHELRSPLTALSLQAENIERTGSFAISKERFIPLKNGLNRSRHLLNQLLDLMRQQGRTIDLAALSLSVIAIAVVEELLPIAESRKIDLGIAGKATVLVDADRSALQLLLRNAVDNALRYTPVGGVVTIHIGSENGFAVLQVVDNGPGIPEAEFERVFDAFYRLPNSTQIGSGLGLAIARSIADQHEGAISLRNVSGGTGLIFTYRQRQSRIIR